MARCPKCHGCRSQWDINNCPYCNYPNPKSVDEDKPLIDKLFENSLQEIKDWEEGFKFWKPKRKLDPFWSSIGRGGFTNILNKLLSEQSKIKKGAKRWNGCKF